MTTVRRRAFGVRAVPEPRSLVERVPRRKHDDEALLGSLNRSHLLRLSPTLRVLIYRFHDERRTTARSRST
jgi:hypothetical protein